MLIVVIRLAIAIYVAYILARRIREYFFGPRLDDTRKSRFSSRTHQKKDPIIDLCPRCGERLEKEMCQYCTK